LITLNRDIVTEIFTQRNLLT